ncbi:alcohol dehydrogenase catalytic domain-containing protein [Streptomyces sp. NBC_01433]|uniref:alcohol dehydrogenase catalytic domain-containing protein n=1 Tax=Streptomyces sp. NBC_01433 TaxID=2903864 RepID=UPI002250319A|nr:alcohol dehydrogenase catalytic domain-containing protein [Streptomyces sp. NBC_01433]MCX4679134.1 alcohol dehydrogenase catalytic domain-containing protein [Streptomyces sp. NBC_01433]
MKAVTSSPVTAVSVVDVARPEPDVGQVLVRVTASGINPVDVDASRSGPWNRTLGWEAAGIVDAVGAGVDDIRPGDVVIGWTYWFSNGHGTQAQYVVLYASATARAPCAVDAAHAATLPLNGSTAWQVLAQLGIKAGESLLVIGAAGAIGGVAIDLATARGVEVRGIASPADAAFVTGRGAHFTARGDAAIDEVLAARPPGVDKVLATARIDDAWHRVIRPGGRFLSTVGQTFPGSDSGFLNAHPDASTLTALAQHVDQGEIRLRTAGRHTFGQAPTAYARAAAPGLRGRVVLIP